jgi:hypothetical protein
MAIQTGRFCLAKSVSVNRWLVEHIGAFIGSGIGAYTAFMAFGGRSMLASGSLFFGSRLALLEQLRLHVSHANIKMVWR